MSARKFFGVKKLGANAKEFKPSTIKSNITSAKKLLSDLSDSGVFDSTGVAEELNTLTNAKDRESYNSRAEQITAKFYKNIQNHIESTKSTYQQITEEQRKNEFAQSRDKFFNVLKSYDIKSTKNDVDSLISLLSSSVPMAIKTETVNLFENEEAELPETAKSVYNEPIEVEINEGRIASNNPLGFDSSKEIEKTNQQLKQVEAAESIEQSIRNEFIDNPIEPNIELNPTQAPISPPIPPKPKAYGSKQSSKMTGAVSELSEPTLPYIEEVIEINDDDEQETQTTQSDQPNGNNNILSTSQISQSVSPSISFGGPENPQNVPKYHLFPIYLFFGSTTEPKWNKVLEQQIRSYQNEKKMSSQIIMAMCKSIVNKNGADILVDKVLSNGDIQELIELIELQFHLNKVGSGLQGIFKLGQLENILKGSGMAGAVNNGVDSNIDGAIDKGNMPIDKGNMPIVQNPFSNGAVQNTESGANGLDKEQRLVQKNLLESKMISEYRNRDRDDANKPITTEIVEQFVIQERQQQSQMKPAYATDFYELTKGYAIAQPVSADINFINFKVVDKKEIVKGSSGGGRKSFDYFHF